METTCCDPYGALGLDDDPEVAFAGVRALRQLAEFCRIATSAGYVKSATGGRRFAGWAGVIAQALHKKHAGT